MVAVTTIITPIWLKMEYRKEQKKGNGDVEASGKSVEQNPE
jgi:hypothetical protein